jgi:hypothetical protein
MLGLSQSSKGEGSPVRGNADCCHLPYQDSRAAHRAPGGVVFHRAIHDQAGGAVLTKFFEQEERCSHLEKSIVMVCDLILGPPSSQV